MLKRYKKSSVKHVYLLAYKEQTFNGKYQSLFSNKHGKRLVLFYQIFTIYAIFTTFINHTSYDLLCINNTREDSKIDYNGRNLWQQAPTYLQSSFIKPTVRRLKINLLPPLDLRFHRTKKAKEFIVLLLQMQDHVARSLKAQKFSRFVFMNFIKISRAMNSTIFNLHFFLMCCSKVVCCACDKNAAILNENYFT